MILCLLSVMLLLMSLGLTRIAADQRMTGYWGNKLKLQLNAEKSLEKVEKETQDFAAVRCKIPPVIEYSLQDLERWQQFSDCEMILDKTKIGRAHV